MTMKYASVGSISSGTMRTEDLLETFADELEGLMKGQPKRALQGSRYRLKWLLKEARAADLESEDADFILEDLTNALEEFAPPFCYFGAHEGDGADYGFWPSHDAIQELPQVNDPSEVKDHRGEDCAFVNDHGNLTVYDGRGRVVLELV